MIKKIIKVILVFLFIFCLNIKADNIDGYYIYSETCLECENISNKINDFCKDKNIEFIVLKNENMDYIKEISEKYDIEKIKVPLLIYNGKVYQTSEVKSFLNNQQNSNLPFILLGFLDGLNPCAISILMIFSSFLITLDKKKQLLFVGLSFIIGETICNFILGLGLLKITNLVSNFSLFLNIIYIFTIFVCLYVLIINSVDIINGFRKNKKIKNMLSLNIRYKINEILSKNITSKFLILIAFIIGFIIAILEFGCTGQIYLPTIIYMNQLNIEGLIALLLYNLMFSLPLVVFLLLALIMNPSKIQKKVMKYSFIIKIFVNIVLIILLIQIIFSFIK